jgi:CheY-like chemotaxis protein
LAEHMGGTISVESKQGVGSVFTVHLPLEMSSEAPSYALAKADYLKTAAPLETLPLFSSKQKKSEPCVLLVEDHDPNILIATTLLEEFQYSYEVAHTGKEALQKLRERNYSLLLLDIHMQDMDGFEVLRLIREKEKQYGLPPIPIIAMTACAMRGDREKCLAAGMDDYIPKPFRPDELRDKLIQYATALAA